MTVSKSFAEKLAEKRAQTEALAPTPPKPPVLDSAPRVEFMASSRSASDQAVDEAVAKLGIVEAYNRYAHKGTCDPGGKTESIKVRCPNPAHPDAEPSAWINTDKDTWYCGGCAEGGDQFDIAAWHFGLPVPGYKEGANFHELRKKIAADQGYVIQQVAGKTVVVPPMELKLVAPLPENPPLEEPMADVVDIDPDDDDDDNDEISIELDWRSIVPEGTFLNTWMRQTVIDDVPEEYHFWNGLLAISMALGKDVTLQDFRPVYGNLFVCIIGRSGSGKSKAKYLLDSLLNETLPYDPLDPISMGVLRVNSPASAEALIWSFQKQISDPLAPKAPPKSYPVRGIVDFSELSSMVGRAGRQGNVLVPTLMQFYDAESTVETVSRTHGVERAVDPYACAVTTTQPKALKSLLTSQDAASGFLNRWFYAAGKPKKRSAIGGARVDITPAIMPLKKIQSWATTAGEIPWSQKAEELFTDFFHTTLHPIQLKDHSDLLNRLDLLCKKLVLLFTANLKLNEVPVAAVKQMIDLFPYLLECYGIPIARVGTTLQEEIRLAILDAIRRTNVRTGKGASNRDLNRSLHRRGYPVDILSRTLKHMVDLEQVEMYSGAGTAGRGRPTIRYYLPEVLTPVDEVPVTPAAPPALPARRGGGGMLSVGGDD